MRKNIYTQTQTKIKKIIIIMRACENIKRNSSTHRSLAETEHMQYTNLLKTTSSIHNEGKDEEGREKVY